MSNSASPKSPSQPTPRVAEDVGDDSGSDSEQKKLDDGSNSDDVWDPAAEVDPRADAGLKDATASGTPSTSTATSGVNISGASAAVATPLGVASSVQAPEWQAIYSPAHNAYYFYNSKTQQTTWTNPLDPSASASASSSTDPSTSTSGASTSTQTLPSTLPRRTTQADDVPEIDPELAFLDPSLASSTSSGAVPTFQAKFNAHTGRFAGGSTGARDPSHVSEYERAKRMSEAYFDVDKWKEEVEAREAKKRAADEEEWYGYDDGSGTGGAKRSKKPTKADLQRFREKKQEKKARKNAWLRE